MTSVDYRVISSDSHVIEPHDLWQQRIEPRYRERAPRLLREAAGDRLVCDMAELPPVGLLAGCARGDDEVRLEGRWEEDVFVGGYDPEVRLGDLARDGVDAEVLYPTVAMQLYPVPDVEFQWALFRAYNSWLGEFVGSHPERYKGIAMLNHEDVEGAVAELHRAKQLGLSGVMVPLYAGEVNRYHDPGLDPLWAAAVDHGMPVSLHAATTRDRSRAWNKGTPTDSVVRPFEIQRVLVDMIYSGLFDRFPELTIVSAENDAGWAGSMVERADFIWHRSLKLKSEGAAVCKGEPSEYFHRNIKLTFMRDHTAVAARDVIGLGTLMWGNDFPHHVSTWPNSRAVLDEHFAHTPPEVRRRVVCDNVRELYGF